MPCRRGRKVDDDATVREWHQSSMGSGARKSVAYRSIKRDARGYPLFLPARSLADEQLTLATQPRPLVVDQEATSRKCKVCGGTLQDEDRLHKTSIAHQIAANASLSKVNAMLPLQRNAARKTIAHQTLERMGWENGKPLGKGKDDASLEPIPLFIRPDRRGIGLALPRSAKVEDQAVATSRSNGKEPVRRQSTTHRDDQWKAIRASLN